MRRAGRNEAPGARRWRLVPLVVLLLLAATAALVVMRSGGPMVAAARIACSGRVEVETGAYPQVRGRGGVGTAYRYHCVEGERSRDITDRTATFFVLGLALGGAAAISLLVAAAKLRR